MDVNSILIAALTTYSMDLKDYKVNIIATNNAISKCKDYLSHNPDYYRLDEKELEYYVSCC